ncbi:MAG: glycosyltransferase family 2 protein [Gaiellaceae bacterium]
MSVVVATRNRAKRLDALLRALCKQSLGRDAFEVVVVDDESEDETAELLRRWTGDQRIALRALRGRGAGPAASRNDGWRSARAELVAFTDDDCEPAPGWLESLAVAAEPDGRCIVQGPTIPIPREEHRLASRARTKSIATMGPWYQTCNMLYPRELLECLGGFDERFSRPAAEDTDLAWRAIEAGASPRFAPAATVHHAVEPMSVWEAVRRGARDPDEALAFKRHRGLRAQAGRAGIFKNPSHAWLSLALLGTSLARRHPAALALALPYARNLSRRSRDPGAGSFSAPVLAGHDLLELAAAIRGSIRHRTLAL